MTTTDRVPDWRLERFLLGELSDEERRVLERQIEADETLRARLAELERENDAILAAYPPGEMAREIELRQHRRQVAARVAGGGRRTRNVVGAFTLLAGAAAVVMLALPPPDDRGVGPDHPLDPVEVTRTKGPALLFVHRQAGAEQQPLADGAEAQAGDLLQVSYRTAEARFAVILSIDGNGSVTTHFPAGTMAEVLFVGGLTELDHSYELDDAPAFERFFFVTARTPFAVREVLQAAEILAPQLTAGEAESPALPLPASFEQRTLLIRKVSR